MENDKEHIKNIHNDLLFVSAALVMVAEGLYEKNDSRIYIINKAHRILLDFAALFSGPDMPTFYSAIPENKSDKKLN